MKRGVLVVISGFSGAGKGTIMRELIEQYPYFLSVSATTRAPREGEVHGREYFFHTREEFQEMIEAGELIEWAEYVGNYYGTPKKAVEQQLSEGKNVLLEIEMQGGMLVKEQFPDALMIFVAPPSADELKKRLIGRATESPEEIESRLKRANEETIYMDKYEYIVVNDNLERAVEQVHSIIENKSCEPYYCEKFICSMKEELAQFLEGDVVS